MKADFRATRGGAERLLSCTHLPRHRHREPYAALVLAGSYEEAGNAGRWLVGPGDVLIHDGFDAHQDKVAPSGCVLLNLALPPRPTQAGAFRLRDPDEIARIAEKDPTAAAAQLQATLDGPVSPVADWPDLLAAEMRRAGRLRIAAWARRHGLAAESVSRGFRRAYGVGPCRYRLEARVLRAWQMLRTENPDLASLAYACGFADQSHLTREIAQLTGLTPARWRARTVSSVQ